MKRNRNLWKIKNINTQMEFIMNRANKHFLSKWQPLWTKFDKAIKYAAGITKERNKLKAEREQILQKEKELREKVQPLVQKLTACTFSHEMDIGQYRLMLCFDTNFVNKCFVWGGSQYEINWYAQAVAERVKHEVIRELKTLNFARYRSHL
jgi:uncharacterized protein YoxC